MKTTKKLALLAMAATIGFFVNAQGTTAAPKQEAKPKTETKAAPAKTESKPAPKKKSTSSKHKSGAKPAAKPAAAKEAPKK